MNLFNFTHTCCGIFFISIIFLRFFRSKQDFFFNILRNCVRRIIPFHCHIKYRILWQIIFPLFCSHFQFSSDKNRQCQGRMKYRYNRCTSKSFPLNIKTFYLYQRRYIFYLFYWFLDWIINDSLVWRVTKYYFPRE